MGDIWGGGGVVKVSNSFLGCLKFQMFFGGEW